MKLRFVRQLKEFDCGYACIEMITGEKLEGDPISVNLMKKLIEEKTGENWEIHGTKEDDEMEEPLPIPITFCETPVLYLVTDLSQPFMVEEPFLAHWVVAYQSNIYDPSYFAPVEAEVYSMTNRYLLRAIKKC